MEETISCCHCRKIVAKSPRHPDQEYCGAADCQRSRKSAWYRQKKASDADYRMNQKAANEVWKKKRPNYWKEYRRQHPDVVKRNREKQRIRNLKKRSVPKTATDASKKIAKIDAPIPYNIWRLLPLSQQDIAKIDASNLLKGTQNGVFLLIPDIAKIDASKNI